MSQTLNLMTVKLMRNLVPDVEILFSSEAILVDIFGAKYLVTFVQQLLKDVYYLKTICISQGFCHEKAAICLSTSSQLFGEFLACSIEMRAVITHPD